MRVSKQARRAAKQIFRSCLVQGLLDEQLVRKAVAAVVELRPRGYYDILLHLRRLVRIEIERRTARIESACPLSDPQRSRIVGQLEKLFGPGLSLVVTENPTLIGGLRVQVGSDVYDGTIAGRLDRLADTF